MRRSILCSAALALIPCAPPAAIAGSSEHQDEEPAAAVAETEAAATEAAEAAPEPLWAVKLALSYVATTGNSETTTLGSAFEAIRRPDPWGFELTASYDRAEDSGVVESERAFGGVRARRALSERWELFGEATGESDEFAGIDLRVVLTAGGTFHALLGPTHLLDLDLGLSWTDEDRVEPAADVDFAGALAGLDYAWKISDRAGFGQRLAWFPNFDRSSDWRLESATTLEAAINDRLALQLAYEVRYSNEPVGGRDDTDTTTRMSLVLNL